jgi:DNA polymerase elongation subunit (family B)
MQAIQSIDTVKDMFVRLYDYNVYNENLDADSSDSDSVYTDKTEFVIQMFGHNINNEKCCIYVRGFKPFFYIKVGKHWGKSNKSDFLSFIQDKIGKYYKNSIVDCKLLKKKVLYGFDAGENHKFIELKFNSMLSYNKTKNLWYDHTRKLLPNGLSYEGENIILYEAHIPPLLRFFHLKNINPTGWIALSSQFVTSVDTPKTSCLHEYDIYYKNITPDNNRETPIPLKICSFDIEASSSHGDFPIPVKTYKKLASQIVEFFEKYVEVTPDEVILRKLINEAFGYENEINEIDIVYSKKHISKECLSESFNKWIVAVPQMDEEYYKIKEYLKIESLFEKIKSEEEDTSSETFYNKSSQPKRMNVIDLLNKKMERSVKIETLTTLLGQYFPKLEGDKVTFIGSTFMRVGEKEPYKNHCIVLNTCDPVPEVEIESYMTEKEVLVAWTKLIQKENPDIIIGYNIFGFDYNFMFHRAQENCCVEPFLRLSVNTNEICGNYINGAYHLEETSIHIASGHHELKYIKMNGRVQIDLYNFFRREENLSSYKLDYVAGHFIGDIVKSIELNENKTTTISASNLTGLTLGSYIHIELIGHSSEYYNNGEKFKVKEIHHKMFVIIGHLHIDMTATEYKIRWCLAKDDVTPKDIFRLTNGSSADRSIIAKYCIQDCNLLHYLMNKVDVWTGISEMSNICSVPVSFIILRGQGIKLTSYVAKKCREKNTLIPVIEKVEDDEGYEGAIVLDPKCDIYLDNPVACVDYASLYPSSMMSENISHDSKVWTKEYDLQGNLTKETGNMKYDNLPDYDYVNISHDIFKYERKTEKSAAVKVKIGTKVCRFAQAKSGQRAIMPSILEELLLARKTTRKQIPLQTDEFMKNVLDKRQLGYKITANSLYGQCGAKTSTFYEKDCAASTTAVGRMLLTYAKKVIENCYSNKICQTKSNGPVLTKAEYIYGDSVASYTPIYVCTVNNLGQEVVDIVKIEDLIHRYGNGKWIKCTEQGRQNKEVYRFNDDYILWTWSETGWTRLESIVRHVLSPNKRMIRILTLNGLVDVTDDHSLLTIHGQEVSPEQVNVGDELLHYPIPCKYYQWGWRNTLPYFKDCYENNCKINILKFWLNQRTQYIEYRDHIKVIGMKYIIPDNIYDDEDSPSFDYNQELLAEIYLCVTQIFKFECHIDIDSSLSIYPSNKYGNNSLDKCYRVKEKIVLDNYCGGQEGTKYVYDLTTENHHFAAGIGSLIVHNTDSVFFTFNLETPEGELIRGKKALEITIELAQQAGHLASSFLKQPHDLEYEKTFMPFCLLSKKRYVGMLYETDVNKCKRKEMGIVLKRRDNAPIVKDIYGGIIDILMKKQNIDEATQFLKSSLKEIINGTIPIHKFIISKSLNSGYKNPQQIAHKVLADRMTQRDPGNKPSSGDRIPYLFIHNANKNALQGEKIETPEYIRENKLKIDYSYYITNQIMKPIQQVFALVLEKIWAKQGKLSKINKLKREIAKIREEETNDEKYFDKIETLKNKEVKSLLFDDTIRETNNIKESNRPMTKYFQKV